jgi:hypothetical protein
MGAVPGGSTKSLDSAKTMSRTRTEILRALVEYQEPLDAVWAELSAFGWDSPEELVILSRADLIRVLDSYLSGRLNADQLERWANLLECRDDVGFPEKDQELLKHAIHQLANPYLEGALTVENVRRMHTELQEVHGAV